MSPQKATSPLSTGPAPQPLTCLRSPGPPPPTLDVLHQWDGRCNLLCLVSRFIRDVVHVGTSFLFAAGCGSTARYSAFRLPAGGHLGRFQLLAVGSGAAADGPAPGSGVDVVPTRCGTNLGVQLPPREPPFNFGELAGCLPLGRNVPTSVCEGPTFSTSRCYQHRPSPAPWGGAGRGSRRSFDLRSPPA